MAGITTHVLDAERGRPVAGVRIDLSVLEGSEWRHLKTATTNADGRTDTPMVPPAEAKTGMYQLEFHVAEVFAARAGTGAVDAFVDDTVVRFSVFDAKQHYHVPLLCTPGSCTTYRGS